MKFRKLLFTLSASVVLSTTLILITIIMSSNTATNRKTVTYSSTALKTEGEGTIYLGSDKKHYIGSGNVKSCFTKINYKQNGSSWVPEAIFKNSALLAE